MNPSGTAGLHGIVRGNSIQLKGSTEFQDGTEVEVVLRQLKESMTFGEGLRRCAGALAADWSEEDDRILAELQAERLTTTHRESLE